MSTYEYPGDELTLFAHADNWKRYFARRLRMYLCGDVLEVGAGLGETARVLCDSRPSSWLCLEPDPRLAASLVARIPSLPSPQRMRVVTGTLAALPPAQCFNAILYIDVLEHIAADREELAMAASRLQPDGVLIVLSPAHMVLFSPFDQAIGHVRRYDRPMLRATIPPELEEVELYYLDAVGMLCSLANRWLLRKSQPSLKEILFWDRRLVPLSCVLDPLLGRHLGRSIIGVWRRRPPTASASGGGAGVATGAGA